MWPRTESTLASPGRVLILVENLPVPFDRRVWLEATTLRDAAGDPQKYDGCAGRRWPKLEVRNWAAYQLATVLAVDVAAFDGSRAVTDEQWARLRKAVAARLAEFRYE